MSPKIKVDNLPSIRVSPKLRIDTEWAASVEQENISEYIRKAVEERNKRVSKAVGRAKELEGKK
jgi:hypothetical protein